MASVEKGEIDCEQALQKVLKVYRELSFKLEETLRTLQPFKSLTLSSKGG